MVTTIERRSQIIATESPIPTVITQEKQVAESTAVVYMPKKTERFSDRTLSKLLGALIAVRKQYGYTDKRLIEEIARYSTSLDARSPKKTRRALVGIVAELNETSHPANSVNQFISTIKDQNKNIL